MRNLLALLAAGLLVFIGLGWYLGWYRVQTSPSADGHRQINVDVNTKKIAEDVGKGVNRSKEAVRDFLDRDDNGGSPAQKKVEAQPASRGGNWQFNPDGSITYRGEVTVPTTGSVNWQR